MRVTWSWKKEDENGILSGVRKECEVMVFERKEGVRGSVVAFLIWSLLPLMR